MEQIDGCIGKYTEGLGQTNCTFVGDNEDVVSMALTVVPRGHLPICLGTIKTLKRVA
jgi:hypothetical protein